MVCAMGKSLLLVLGAVLMTATACTRTTGLTGTPPPPEVAPSPPATIVVPKVVGMTEHAATRVILMSGLRVKYEIAGGHSRTIRVTRQRPKPGTETTSDVVVTVVLGPVYPLTRGNQVHHQTVSSSP